MLYRALADLVVLVHLAFIVFAVIGGLLVLKNRWLIWFHVPAATWAALIEFRGWPCPLTPLEIGLRLAASDAGYETGFIEQYLVPIIYPQGLTSDIAVLLGIFVVTINLTIYGWLLLRLRKKGA